MGARGACLPSGNFKWILRCDWIKCYCRSTMKGKQGKCWDSFPWPGTLISMPLSLWATSIKSSECQDFFKDFQTPAKLKAFTWHRLCASLNFAAHFTWPHPAERRDGCSQLSIPLRAQSSFRNSFAGGSLSGQQPIPLKLSTVEYGWPLLWFLKLWENIFASLNFLENDLYLNP